jgi:hypothetical protein
VRILRLTVEPLRSVEQRLFTSTACDGGTLSKNSANVIASGSEAAGVAGGFVMSVSVMLRVSLGSQRRPWLSRADASHSSRAPQRGRVVGTEAANEEVAPVALAHRHGRALVKLGQRRRGRAFHLAQVCGAASVRRGHAGRSLAGLAGHPLDLGAPGAGTQHLRMLPARRYVASMVKFATTIALSLPSPLAVAQPPAPVPTAAIIVAQGGFTFGRPDDLGPRYDQGSDRWETYQQPYGKVCRWVTVRIPTVNGKVTLQRQHVCGFKVPARR